MFNFYFFLSLCLSLVLQPILGQNQKLSLEKCYATIKNNPQILRQKYTSDLNAASVEQLKANRIPSVNGSVSQNINFGRSIDPFTNQFVQKQILSNNFSLNSSLVLFNGLQNNWLIAQNQHAIQANDYATEKLINDLCANAANLYFEILMNSEQLKTLNLQIENTKIQLEKAQKLVKNGASTEANLLQLEAQQLNEENTIFNLKSKISIAKNNLCLVLNIPYDTTLSLDFDTTALSFHTKDAQLNFENFPQIKESNERIRIAYYSYRASRGSQMPKLVLNAGITTVYSNQNKENFGSAATRFNFTGFVNNDVNSPVFLPYQTYDKRTVGFYNQLDQNLSQYVNLQLQIPIFNNKLVHTNIKKSVINQKTSELNKQIAQRQLEADFNQIKINYENSIGKFQNTNKQLDFNKRYYTTMEKRYDAGISDLYILLLEKNKVINTETELLRLKYEALFYEKMLDFYAKGGF